MALADTARLATVLTLKDGLSPGLNKSIGTVGRFSTGLSRAGAGVGKFASGVTKAGLAVGAFAITGLAASAKAAIDWQDAFQGVVKTVDEADLKSAGLTFDDLAQGLRAMAREMPNTATELAGIAEQAGALGIKSKDILAFTKQVAILASTTDVSADQAATALGQLQNVIGLTGDEFDNFAATLVDLGNKGASTESQILEIARRSGGAAKLIGIAKDATLGWASAAANLGISEELAGTSLQNFYLKALNATRGGDKLRVMAKVAGSSAAAFRKSFDKDATGALERFLKGLGKLSKDQRLQVVQDVFGKGTGLTRLVLGLADSFDSNLSPALKDSVKAWKEATAAQAEFDKRNATVRSALSRLRNNLVDAEITIGEGFAPAIGRAADKLSEFLKVPENRAGLKSLGEDVGRMIDAIDWNGLLRDAKGFATALEKAGEFARGLWSAFSNLPPEVKGTLLALAGLNKLSGGAVSGAIGGVVGGLGSALAKSLASSIPLFGKAFVQPVFVTNMVPGGLGGGIPGGGGGIGGKLASAAKWIVPVGVGLAIGDALGAMFPKLRADIISALGIGGPREQGITFFDQTKGNRTLPRTVQLDAKSRKAYTDLINKITPLIRSTSPLHADLYHIGSLYRQLAKAQAAGDTARAAKIQAKIDKATGHLAAEARREQARIERLRHQNQRDTSRTVAHIDAQRRALAHRLEQVRHQNQRTTSATIATRDAIRHKKLNVRTTVNVVARTNVSVRNVNSSVSTSNRYSARSMNQAS